MEGEKRVGDIRKGNRRDECDQCTFYECIEMS
jgi:hypothetical protein